MYRIVDTVGKEYTFTDANKKESKVSVVACMVCDPNDQVNPNEPFLTTMTIEEYSLITQIQSIFDSLRFSDAAKDEFWNKIARYCESKNNKTEQ